VATLVNGNPYANSGIGITTMQWGKVHSLDVFEDSQAVAVSLDKQAQSGNAVRRKTRHACAP
jgi:hypothetical protein